MLLTRPAPMPAIMECIPCGIRRPRLMWCTWAMRSDMEAT